MRLTPPTKSTFWLALLALAAGIALQIGVAGEDLAGDVAFWLTAGGGLLLVVGVIFRRI